MVSLESPLRAGATQAFPGGGLETYTEGSMIGSRSRVRGRVTALRVERDVVRFAVDLEAIDGGRTLTGAIDARRADGFDIRACTY